MGCVLPGFPKASNLDNCGAIEECDSDLKRIDINSDCRSCAYPAFFEKYLKQTYPHVNITVYNWATGGCGSQCCLIQRASQLAGLKHLDAVFTYFRTNDHCDSYQYEAMSARYEQLIRFLLSHPSAPVVIPIRMVQPYPFPPHDEVSLHYKLPDIDVESNALQDIPEAPIRWDPADFGDHWLPLWPRTGNDAHPSWPYHQSLGEFLAVVWYRQIKHSMQSSHHERYTLPPPLRNTSGNSVAEKVCSQPETLLLPTESIAQSVFSSADGWVLGEDKAHNQKPGWWLDNPLGGTITFTLKVRKTKPFIGIVYLTSYENMGTAEFFLGNDEVNGVKIDALDTSRRVSISMYTVLCLSRQAVPSNDVPVFPNCQTDADINELGRHHGNAVLFDTHELSVRLLPQAKGAVGGNKFKILQIVSC